MEKHTHTSWQQINLIIMFSTLFMSHIVVTLRICHPGWQTTKLSIEKDRSFTMCMKMFTLPSCASFLLPKAKLFLKNHSNKDLLSGPFKFIYGIFAAAPKTHASVYINHVLKSLLSFLIIFDWTRGCNVSYFIGG